MTQFWKAWLTVWCFGVLVFGALLVTAAVPGFDGAIRGLVILFSGGSVDAAALDQPIVRFGLGLQGALTIGWALTIFPLLRAADALGAPVWRALTFAMLVWYVIDSAISIATGVALNAVSNTVLMVAFLIPVLASGALRR